MKYKKRSLKKKQRRHRFSKKYYQRGGGFMETIAELIAMEGRTNACMAVHPTEPLVVVGDDAGNVTLFEINPLGQAPPKKLAQLVGLPTAVKCVEFHKTFPLVAGACNDRVLMWRFDQISREQQDQQVQPSHMVSDFRARNETEVQKELSETKIILEEAEKERRAIIHDQVTIKNNLRDIEKKITAINEDNIFRKGAISLQERAFDIKRRLKQAEDFNREEKSRIFESRGVMDSESLRKLGKEVEKQLEPLRQELEEPQAQKKTMTERFNELETRLKSITTLDKEKKIRELDRELTFIRAGVRNEVSCIAFYPGNYMSGKYSYIAVGVNNIHDNQIIIYRFNIEPSSLVKEYSISSNSLHPGPLDDVLMVSFSHDGKLFAFVTKSSDGITILKVRNFKGPETRYYETEYESYRIDAEKKRAITSIRPFSSNIGVFSWGTEHKHNFLIGCDDGYLTMIEAKTQTSKNYSAETRIQDLKSIREWNAGEEPIKCVAVHPSLPLFASGTRDAKLWDIDQREPLKSLALQDVISVGFNQQFLAVCGPRSMRFYSCNPHDYGGFKEKYKKRKKILGDLYDELIEKTLTEKCAICLEPMINPLTESAIRFGPKEEGYLPCHKFHKKCIQQWLDQGKTSCPGCRSLVPPGGLTLSTPQKVLANRRQNIEEMNKKWKDFDNYVQKETAKRALNFSTDVPPPPLAQGSPLRFVQGIRSDQQQPPQSSERPDYTPLTLEELRAARLADIEIRRNEQQQPSSENSGGSKNKYSSKKNTSKKSKSRRRYSKKYKYN
jgi:WD40 repeat protein